MKSQVRRTLWLLLVIGLTVVMVLPGPSEAAQKVKVGYLRLIYFAPLFIAIDNGNFADEGIEIELIRFASGAKMNAPLASGELQATTAAASAGLFNAILRGQEFRIVADSGQVRPGYGSSALIVRNDHLNSGRIKSIKDLKGMRVARFAKGNIGDFMLGQVLLSAGLTLKDINLVALPPPKIIGALKGKAIDASTIGEPLATLAEVKKVARKLITMDKIESVGGELQIGTVIFSGKFRADRATAQKFINAYLKGARFFNKHGMKSPEVIKILTKYTKVPGKILKMATAFYLSPDGKPNMKSLKQFVDWAYDVGYIKKKLPLSKLVDLSFLK